MVLELQTTSANSANQATHVPIDPRQVVDDVLGHLWQLGQK